MSVPFLLRDVAAWTGGELVSGDAETCFDGVSTDTRTLAEGALFVAIRGPNHDAHHYLDRALEAGARGLLVERDRPLPASASAGGALPVVAVPDTTRALGALAAGHRSGFDGPVVAITGSNGKTTTKEMCAAILGVAAPCLKNRGNLNNEFGLPLTLLEREAEHRALVVEIGMNHRGEIAPLTVIARPTVGVITNVGTAHIEHLGSQEEIALEKGDLVAGLEASAVAVLNADDARVMAQAGRCAARVSSFGTGPEADVRAERVSALGERGFAFELVTGSERRPVQVAGLGEPTVANALAAAAGALAAGASLDHVVEGLARHRPVGGRMECVTLPGDVVVIDDTYNANPQSVEVALRSLASLAAGARAIAVLGDMGELGETASEAHRAAGRLVAKLGIDFLFALGERAGEVAAGAGEAGMDAGRVHVGSDHAETGAAVREILGRGDRVLVKGSRAMRMERIVEVLTKGGEA